MFRNSVRLYVYPMRAAAYQRYVATAVPAGAASPAADTLITAGDIQVPSNLRHLFTHLIENRYIEGVTGFNQATLDIISRDVLAKIRSGDSTWEPAVPPAVAELIKQRRLFDYAQRQPK
jgi:hypothetical protein